MTSKWGSNHLAPAFGVLWLLAATPGPRLKIRFEEAWAEAGGKVGAHWRDISWNRWRSVPNVGSKAAFQRHTWGLRVGFGEYGPGRRRTNGKLEVSTADAQARVNLSSDLENSFGVPDGLHVELLSRRGSDIRMRGLESLGQQTHRKGSFECSACPLTFELLGKEWMMEK